MSFPTAWLLNEMEDVPEEMLGTATALRAFLHGAVDAAAAEELAQVDSIALISLIETLEARNDGARLALLRAAPLPKKARKATGKAIHKLKTRGIACEAPAGRVGIMRYQTDRLPSYMALPMATGVRLLILSEHVAGPGNVTCYAVVDDDGVEELVAMDEPSRRKIRKLIDSIEEPGDSGSQLFFVEADPAFVRARLTEAIDAHRANNGPPLEDLDYCRMVLEGDTTDVHPALDLVGPCDPSLVKRGAELLGCPTDTGYIQGPADRPVLSDDWQIDASKRLGDACDSPVVVDESQRRSRVIDEVDRLTEDTFDEAQRARSARRLRDSAYVLKLGRRDEEAQIALATAAALDDLEIATLDIPWARESVHGIIDVDHLLERQHQHVHGPDCDHDHDHEGPASGGDEPGSLIIPG